MNPNIIKLFFAAGALLVFAILSYQFLKFALQMNRAKKNNYRLAQLQSIDKRKKTEFESNQEFIRQATSPIIQHVLPRINLKKDYHTIEQELKLIGWDKLLTPQQHVAASIGLKLLACILLILWLPFSLYMGALFFSVFFFIYDLGFKGQVNDKKEKILIEFPDVIEVLEGYLSAGYDFIHATEETIGFTNHWQPFLKEMVVIAKYDSLQSALKMTSQNIDIFEVREFFAILQLGLSQGLDMRSNIEHQATRIDELRDVAFSKKVAKRQMLGIVVQGPLLIAILIAFAAPTVRDFMMLGA